MQRRTFAALLAALWLPGAWAAPATRDSEVAFVKKAAAHLGQAGKFVWPHPVTGVLEPRASYFERAGDVIVLAGVYGQK